jgi:hypothetical protein
MTRKRIVTTAVAASLLAGAGGAAAASGGVTDTASPMMGADLDRARAAALAFTGGGFVTEAEVDDDESRYEVEVTLPDGRQVGVRLDETFTVVGSSVDEPSDDDEPFEDADGDDDGSD